MSRTLLHEGKISEQSKKACLIKVKFWLLDAEGKEENGYIELWFPKRFVQEEGDAVYVPDWLVRKKNEELKLIFQHNMKDIAIITGDKP